MSIAKQKKKKILVVDDEIHIRQLACRMLGKEYDVLEAINGEEAVDIARSRKPDAILMDMLMPKMDGFSACYTLKNDRITGRIPVIMLTAVDTVGNRKMAQEVWKADAYISKPFNSNILIETIEKSLKAVQ
jgi:CheY-like chemotaxis protein